MTPGPRRPLLSALRGFATGTRQGTSSRESGSVSVVAAAVMVVALAMAMGIADVVKVLIGVDRAQTAADAAALSAAQEMASGSGDPTEAARTFAGRNGAVLEACDCPEGGTEAVAGVRVRVTGLLLLGGDRIVTARARAVVDYRGA